MQKRHFGAVHANLWEFPGGKVEPGESPVEAAVREIDEELGLTLAQGDLVPVAQASESLTSADSDIGGGTGEVQTVTMLLYACRRWRGQPEVRAAQEIGWFAAETLAGLAMPPVDRPLAERLCRLLSHKVI